MPRLSDPQRETYAQQRASGKSRSEAARVADYKAFGNQGHRLSKEPKVIARIEEIKKTYSEESIADPTAKDTGRLPVVANIVAVFKLAKKAKEYGVALQCQRTLAQIGGWLSDGPGVRRPQTNNTVNLITADPAALNEVLTKQLEHLPAAERKRLLAQPDLADVIDLEPESESTARAEGVAPDQSA